MKKVFAKKEIILLTMPAFLISCSKSYQKVVFAMDTEISCQAKVDNESEIGDVLSVFETVEAYADATYHHYKVTGVYDINNATSPIEIGKDLYDLLSFALEMQEATSGYFNPLCLDLDNLWKNSLHPSKEGAVASLPSQEEIQTEVEKISNTSLRLENKGGVYTAFLEARDSSMGRASLDLGGIAKGYAAKKAKEKAESYNWKNFYINGGNSTMVLGEAEQNDGYFTIAWKDDLPGKKMKVKSTCLSTSSMTVQGVEIGGRMYSHLINPFTGEASPSITGVTLLGEDPAMLDAFSTALMWMSEESRVSLEEKYDLKAVYFKDGAILRDTIGLFDA